MGDNDDDDDDDDRAMFRSCSLIFFVFIFLPLHLTSAVRIVFFHFELNRIVELLFEISNPIE